MTEQDWLSCTDPQQMLEILRASGKLPERKARLFSVAVCRQLWRLLADKDSRKALDVVERYAEGTASEADLESAASLALGPMLASGFCGRVRARVSPARDVAGAVWYAANRAIPWEQTTAYVANMTARAADPHAEGRAQAVLLRDIFGTPFRPVAVDPAWLRWNDGTVVKLAQAIYEERAFDRLPLLADALLDAGCDTEELLAHCRSAGPHARGCWAVDLILGKE